MFYEYGREVTTPLHTLRGVFALCKCQAGFINTSQFKSSTYRPGCSLDKMYVCRFSNLLLITPPFEFLFTWLVSMSCFGALRKVRRTEPISDMFKSIL
jgi:hypothetical protein